MDEPEEILNRAPSLGNFPPPMRSLLYKESGDLEEINYLPPSVNEVYQPIIEATKRRSRLWSAGSRSSK